MKIKNILLLITVLLLILLVHTMEYNRMHEITKKQEGTFYTVSCSFLQDSSNRQYTYKVPNEQDAIDLGDLAIVETNSGFKIVKVKAIHDIPQIDYSAPYEYSWIVGTVPLQDYLVTKATEKQLKAQLIDTNAKSVRF